jgi:hypothetical protein
MNTVCTGLKTESWKELYQAAVCESDLNKLPGRIDDAENRARQMCATTVFSAVDDGEEGESLDDAMCILHALSSSLKHRPTAVQSAGSFDHLKSA